MITCECDAPLKIKKKTTPKQEIAVVWFPSVKQASALTDISSTLVVLHDWTGICQLDCDKRMHIRIRNRKKSFGQTIYGAQPFSPKGLPRVRRAKHNCSGWSTKLIDSSMMGPG
jgi:hypothetical protein